VRPPTIGLEEPSAEDPPSMRMLTELRGTALRAANSHSPRWDSFLYNSCATGSVVFTALATFLPESNTVPWLARGLTGAAFCLILLERTLNFGGRWRFHRRMQHAYTSIADDIDIFLARAEHLTRSEIADKGKRLSKELQRLRRKEGNVPGTPAV
jgi:hypothetical protein